MPESINTYAKVLHLILSKIFVFTVIAMFPCFIILPCNKMHKSIVTSLVIASVQQKSVQVLGISVCFYRQGSDNGY